MADIMAVLFFFQLIILISIVLVRTYNLLKGGELYGFEVTFISFIISCIMFYLGFSVVMSDYTTSIYGSIFSMEVLLFILNVFFFIAEIIINLKTPGMRRNSREVYAKNDGA